jgi:hypothetical protein
MKKTIRLTESDLTRIIRKVLNETTETTQEVTVKKPTYFGECFASYDYPKHKWVWVVSPEELKQTDETGACKKIMYANEGNLKKEDVSPCVTALCDLKRLKNTQNVITAFSCLRDRYKSSYDIMTIMC